MASLRALRNAKLLTIRALAAESGVAQRSIVLAESGRVSPQFGTMRRLAAALNVEPTEIDEFKAAIEARGKGLAA